MGLQHELRGKEERRGGAGIGDLISVSWPNKEKGLTTLRSIQISLRMRCGKKQKLTVLH